MEKESEDTHVETSELETTTIPGPNVMVQGGERAVEVRESLKPAATAPLGYGDTSVDDMRPVFEEAAPQVREAIRQDEVERVVPRQDDGTAQVGKTVENRAPTQAASERGKHLVSRRAHWSTRGRRVSAEYQDTRGLSRVVTRKRIGGCVA